MTYNKTDEEDLVSVLEESKKMSEDNNENLPLVWKKAQVVSQILASILIPGVVTVVGLIINSSISRDDLKLRYIDMATKILQLEKLPQNDKLREWAVKTLNHYAEVKMSEEAQQEAKEWFTTIKGDPKYTDFGVFVCPENQSKALVIANAIVKQIQKDKFGTIKRGIWEEDNQLSKEKRTRKFTIIVDKKLPEVVELNRIKNWLQKADPNLEIQELDNPGKSTPWYISIVVCP